MTEAGRILIVGGADGYGIGDETYELLTEATLLAKQAECSIDVVLFGHELDREIAEMEQTGQADAIYAYVGDQFAAYTPHEYLGVVTRLFDELQPFLILCSAGSMGADFAPRAAYHLEGGFVSSVQQIRLTREGELEAIKPVYGGKAHAVLRLSSDCPWVATIIPGVVGVDAKRGSRATRVVRRSGLPIADAAPAMRYKVVDFLKADPRTLDVAEADVVVAGGNGVGGEEEFIALGALAQLMGAALGCSRPIVDKHILPSEKQIGQTGKTVRPRLFVSCGISGAIQHEMGMKDAKTIVAINKDPQAPVFRIAHLKVVADLHEVLPTIIGRIEGWKRAKAVGQ